MKFSNEIKVGLFAAAAILIVTFATIRVGDQSIISGGGYNLLAIFNNAAGLYAKGTVEVAGVEVGVVKSVNLTQDGKAQVVMGIQKSIHLPQNSVCFLKTRGFLGEAYVEIVPGDPSLPPLKNGEYFSQTQGGGDINGLVNQFNAVADDVKDITSTVKGWTDEKQGGPVALTIHNLNDFVRVLRDVTARNEQNLDRIISNMAEMTHDIKDMVQASKGNVEASAERIASISKKIDEGRGSIGKLVNDPATVDKLNDSLDSLSEALGGYRQMELGFGFHTEYLKGTDSFKNYFGVSLAPTPDEAVMLDLVSDSLPPLKRQQTNSAITVNGVTTNVSTETSVLNRNSLLFSAQLAKKLYNFTVRGGVIESTGGVGLDYSQGPVGLQFSAFDFQTKFGEEPHLKVLGAYNLTNNFFLVGGLDDPLNPNQPKDWFGGAGFRLVDDNFKSLLGLSSAVKK